jgi:hypothetical protein
MSNPMIGTTLGAIDAVALFATIIYFQKQNAALSDRVKKLEDALETHTQQVRSTFISIGKENEQQREVSKSHLELTKKCKKIEKTLSTHNLLLTAFSPTSRYSPSPKKIECVEIKEIPTRKPMKGSKCKPPAVEPKRKVIKVESEYEEEAEDGTSESESESESECEPPAPTPKTSTKTSNRLPPVSKQDPDISAVIAAASKKP